MRILLFIALLFPSLAIAQEQASSTYSPEFCEFSIEFPSEPYTSRRCEDAAEKRCYDQVSYTQVFENLSSTVNFRVICNAIDENVIESYSGEVMEATLRAMTKRSVVNTYDTSFREEERYKQAGLVGEGKVGKLSTLYIAQLWIGERSAFTVEAELIGEAAPAPDELFRDVLRSVVLKGEQEQDDDTQATPSSPAQKN